MAVVGTRLYNGIHRQSEICPLHCYNTQLLIHSGYIINEFAQHITNTSVVCTQLN
jgi:hypothetical protein